MGGGPLGGEVLQIAVVIGSKAAVCAAADLAFCLVAAVRLAAGALAVFAVALITGAGAGVGAVAVGRPFAPVVVESVALGDLADLAGLWRDAGRGAVAAAARPVNRVAAITLAGTGVGLVVIIGLPRAPVVAQNTVFLAAFIAGFARGAGGRFGAAAVTA